MSTTFIRGIEAFTPRDGSVVTVGTFDGIHRGHQAIFAEVRRRAGEMRLNPVLVTFHPHPRVVTTPDNVPALLTTIEEKEQFIPDFFDGQVLVLAFDEHLKDMSAEQFVKEVLVDKVHCRLLIVGYDHALGRNREGRVDYLRELGRKHGFEVEVVGPVTVDGQPISSSRIRKALAGGELEEALRLLGHEYAVYGRVERGIGLGRKLGYPTANVAYSPRKLLPPEGVYACWVETDDGSHPGMMFIGQNQFNPERKISVEANIFDFDRDLYDQPVIVYPTRYIRPSRKFESPEALAAQLRQDKEEVLQIIREGERACR